MISAGDEEPKSQAPKNKNQTRRTPFQILDLQSHILSFLLSKAKTFIV